MILFQTIDNDWIMKLGLEEFIAYQTQYSVLLSSKVVLYYHRVPEHSTMVVMNLTDWFYWKLNPYNKETKLNLKHNVYNIFYYINKKKIIVDKKK